MPALFPSQHKVLMIDARRPSWANSARLLHNWIAITNHLSVRFSHQLATAAASRSQVKHDNTNSASTALSRPLLHRRAVSRRSSKEAASIWDNNCDRNETALLTSGNSFQTANDDNSNFQAAHTVQMRPVEDKDAACDAERRRPQRAPGEQVRSCESAPLSCLLSSQPDESSLVVQQPLEPKLSRSPQAAASAAAERRVKEPPAAQQSSALGKHSTCDYEPPKGVRLAQSRLHRARRGQLNTICGDKSSSSSSSAAAAAATQSRNLQLQDNDDENLLTTPANQSGGFSATTKRAARSATCEPVLLMERNQLRTFYLHEFLLTDQLNYRSIKSVDSKQSQVNRQQHQDSTEAATRPTGWHQDDQEDEDEPADEHRADQMDKLAENLADFAQRSGCVHCLRRHQLLMLVRNEQILTRLAARIKRGGRWSRDRDEDAREPQVSLDDNNNSSGLAKKDLFKSLSYGSCLASLADQTVDHKTGQCSLDSSNDQPPEGSSRLAPPTVGCPSIIGGDGEQNSPSQCSSRSTALRPTKVQVSKVQPADVTLVESRQPTRAALELAARLDSCKLHSEIKFERQYDELESGELESEDLNDLEPPEEADLSGHEELEDGDADEDECEVDEEDAQDVEEELDDEEEPEEDAEPELEDDDDDEEELEESIVVLDSDEANSCSASSQTNNSSSSASLSSIAVDFTSSAKCSEPMMDRIVKKLSSLASLDISLGSPIRPARNSSFKRQQLTTKNSSSGRLLKSHKLKTTPRQVTEPSMAKFCLQRQRRLALSGASAGRNAHRLSYELSDDECRDESAAISTPGNALTSVFGKRVTSTSSALDSSSQYRAEALNFYRQHFNNPNLVQRRHHRRRPSSQVRNSASILSASSVSNVNSQRLVLVGPSGNRRDQNRYNCDTESINCDQSDLAGLELARSGKALARRSSSQQDLQEHPTDISQLYHESAVLLSAFDAPLHKYLSLDKEDFIR